MKNFILLCSSFPISKPGNFKSSNVLWGLLWKEISISKCHCPNSRYASILGINPPRKKQSEVFHNSNKRSKVFQKGATKGDDTRMWWRHLLWLYQRWKKTMNSILCIHKYIYYSLLLAININSYKANIVRVGVGVPYSHFQLKSGMGKNHNLTSYDCY